MYIRIYIRYASYSLHACVYVYVYVYVRSHMRAYCMRSCVRMCLCVWYPRGGQLNNVKIIEKIKVRREKGRLLVELKVA